jgi:hydroxymethylpyrimidine/phosphomethylpyrimidine kinase
MKHLLTIAGSDCSGGAGIQADLKTFAAHGTYGMSVVTAVVAENTQGVYSISEIPAQSIAEQMDAVFEDIRVDAIKIGMLSSVDAMRAVSQKCAQYARNIPIIVDPVMIAKGGHALMHPDAMHTLITEILPHADVLTPNIPEAEVISGIKITSDADRALAAQRIHAMGVQYVLIKGGHMEGGTADDLFFDGKEFHTFSANRILTNNTHGTGCTLSSAIAANMALLNAQTPNDVRAAIQNAKEYITGAIENALEIGHGHGPTHHFYNVKILSNKGLKGAHHDTN